MLGILKTCFKTRNNIIFLNYALISFVVLYEGGGTSGWVALSSPTATA